MHTAAQKIIEQLGLSPLPEEGGFFRQTWLSSDRTQSGHPCGSAILFLLTDTDFSALHRLLTDEIWHHCAGDPVTLLQLDPKNGRSLISRLSGDVLAGETPQVVVPGGVWQGAQLSTGQPGNNGWALLGCTMAPAWDQRGFELGHRAELIRAFPSQRDLVTALTR